jgi:hypothetical protein
MWLWEGREARPGRHQWCGTIRHAVDDGEAEKMKKAQDFKSSLHQPLHSRYD